MNMCSNIRPLSKFGKRGFTLTEILVVILIIAVLAGVAFPVFSRAKRKAKDVSCISNMRQLGQACQMYMTDSDGSLPIAPPYRQNPPGRIVNPLEQYGMSVGLYQCPNFANENPAYNPDDKTRIDYVSRYAILARRSDGFQAGWRVIPTDGFVLSYCPYHRDGTGKEVSGAPNGFFNALRITGEVKLIPVGSVKEHKEDWGGFGPDVDPNAYAWLQFPDETFPPQVILNP